MGTQSFRRALLLGVVVVVTEISRQAWAAMVQPGYDLLHSVSGHTIFMGQSFEGWFLGTHDFGGSIGTVALGNTDTIIRRDAGSSDTEFLFTVVALQLRSATPFSPGSDSPKDYYFITLQSTDGGQASTGLLMLDSGGTFTSQNNVYYDVRVGSISGAIITSGNFSVTGGGKWDHTGPADALRIPGVNYLLNGADGSGDFWLTQDGIVNHSDLSEHVLVPSTPEPSTWIAAALLLVPFTIQGARYLHRLAV